MEISVRTHTGILGACVLPAMAMLAGCAYQKYMAEEEARMHAYNQALTQEEGKKKEIMDERGELEAKKADLRREIRALETEVAQMESLTASRPDPELEAQVAQKRLEVERKKEELRSYE